MEHSKQLYYSEDDGISISGNNSEVAEPNDSDTDTDNFDTDNVKDLGAKDQEAAELEKQSDEDNAKYAAARREAEKKAKEAEQKASRLERDNLIARKYGQEYGVFSEEDIQKEHNMSFEEFEKTIQEQRYRDAGIDPDLLNQAINNHPVVQKASEYTRQLEEQKRQDRIKQDIDNLHKEFPGTFDHIKAENDIYNDPKFSEVYTWLEKGYELSDAFYKVYRNDVVNKSTQTAVKSTIANIQDKAKRGIVNNDNNVSQSYEMSSFGVEMAKRMGLDPSEVANVVKERKSNYGRR
jgi:hypothetical protein